MKKALIIGGIGLAIGVAIFFIVKANKKPCPCKGISPDEAIAKMSKEDLIEQIKAIKPSAVVDGKSIDELKTLLKSII